MADLCSKFLNSCVVKLAADELATVTFQDYKACTDLLVEFFGKHAAVEDLEPADFHRLRNRMGVADRVIAVIPENR